MLDAESIYDIESTGAQVLDALDERDITFAMARVRTEIRGELAASGIEAREGTEHIYLGIDDVVRAHVTKGRSSDAASR